MESGNIRLEKDGAVAVVRLARPEKKNALSLAMLRDLLAVCAELSADTSVTSVVFTGGPETFTAGMDLLDPELHALAGASIDDQRLLMDVAPRACRAVEQLAQYTIFAIEGFCVGGGVSLAVCADYRVMGKSATVRAPEIDYGMNMSWGTLPRLVHLVGPARAKELIVLGEAVGAETALSWGFAQDLAADGSALETALALARRVAAKPRHAVAMCKETVNALVTAHDGVASHMDRDQFLYSVTSPEFARRLAQRFGKGGGGED